MKYRTEKPTFKKPFIKVELYEKGLLLRRGRVIRTLEPGSYFKIPKVDEIKIVDLRPQEYNTKLNLVTSDRQNIDSSIKVIYKVDNVENAISRAPENFKDYLNNFIQSYAQKEVSKNITLDYALSNRDVIGSNLEDLLKDSVKNFGIGIEKVLVYELNVPASVIGTTTKLREANEESLIAEKEADVRFKKARRTAEIEESVLRNQAKKVEIISNAILNLSKEQIKYQLEIVARKAKVQADIIQQRLEIEAKRVSLETRELERRIGIDTNSKVKIKKSDSDHIRSKADALESMLPKFKMESKDFSIASYPIFSEQFNNDANGGTIKQYVQDVITNRLNVKKEIDKEIEKLNALAETIDLKTSKIYEIEETKKIIEKVAESMKNGNTLGINVNGGTILDVANKLMTNLFPKDKTDDKIIKLPNGS